MFICHLNVLWRHLCYDDYLYRLDTSHPCKWFLCYDMLEIVGVIIIIIIIIIISALAP